MVKNIGPLLEYREKSRAYRKANGVECPGCKTRWPKRTPTKLVPQQVCKVCLWKDMRPAPGQVVGTAAEQAPTSTASVIQDPAPATSESGA